MAHLRGIAFVSLLFLLCPALTFPQDATQPKDGTESTASANSQPKPPESRPKDANSQLNASEYVGSAFQRFLLGLQYQYQYAEQPDHILVSQPGNTQVLSANPEHSLNQHSLIFDFSQVFLTPAQLARARKYILKSDSMLFCNKRDDPLTCVAGGEGGAKRFLSGLKFTANFSEHPVAVQQAILPAGYLYGGEVDFNPTNLFTTGTDWKNSMSDSDEDKKILLEKLHCTMPQPNQKDAVAEKQAEIETVNCARRGLLAFHGPTRSKTWEAILYSMAPTFQYKRLTPFDFLKYAGTFIPSSNSGGLNSFTVTVDVRRLIASATSRMDAIDATKSILPGAATVPVLKLCGLLFKGGSLSIISVPSGTSKESCRETANAIKAEKYELGCGGKDTVLGPATDPIDVPVPASALPTNCTWEE